MQLLEYAMAFVNAAANGDQGLVRDPAPLHRIFRYPESMENPELWPASTIAATVSCITSYLVLETHHYWVWCRTQSQRRTRKKSF